MDWDYNYVIAVDYDGTLCKDRDRRLLDEDILYFTKRAKNLGCIVILWTSRCDHELQEAIDTCSERGLYFDYINEYPKRTKSPKICADIYLDNKSVPNGKIPLRKFYKQLRKELESGKYILIQRI